jgi:hypothetical protein
MRQGNRLQKRTIRGSQSGLSKQPLEANARHEQSCLRATADYRISDTPDRVKLKAIEILFGQTLNQDNLALADRLNELEEQIRLKSVEQPPAMTGTTTTR